MRLSALASFVVTFYKPQTQTWLDHFRWENGGTHIIGLTETGRATVMALRLNNEYVTESRALWILMGWHPPKDP